MILFDGKTKTELEAELEVLYKNITTSLAVNIV